MSRAAAAVNFVLRRDKGGKTRQRWMPCIGDAQVLQHFVEASFGDAPELAIGGKHFAGVANSVFDKFIDAVRHSIVSRGRISARNAASQRPMT